MDKNNKSKNFIMDENNISKNSPKRKMIQLYKKLNIDLNSKSGNYTGVSTPTEKPKF